MSMALGLSLLFTRHFAVLRLLPLRTYMPQDLAFQLKSVILPGYKIGNKPAER